MGGGEMAPAGLAGFICNLMLAPGTGVRALPRETGGHLAGLPERELGGGNLGRVEGKDRGRGVGAALSLLLKGGRCISNSRPVCANVLVWLWANHSTS